MSRIGSTIDSIWSLAFEGWVNVPGCLIHSCDHEQSCCLVSHSFRINHREVGHGQTFGSDVEARARITFTPAKTEYICKSEPMGTARDHWHECIFVLEYTCQMK